MTEPFMVARAAPALERRRVVREIPDCPRPALGCDAQFNHLLDIRWLEKASAEFESGEPIATSGRPL